MAAMQMNASVFPPLKFHSRHGAQMKLSHNGQTAERRNPEEEYCDGIVLTDKHLFNDQLFEIQIDKLLPNKWEGSVQIGVTSQAPEVTPFMKEMTELKPDSAVTCIKLTYPDVYFNWGDRPEASGQLDKQTLIEGDCLGVIRETNGSVHFYVNGQDLGVSIDYCPSPVWGFVNLYGNGVKVTCMQPAVLTAYEHAKTRDPNGVYRMESNPRGLALIIDNFNFENSQPRVGTRDDCEDLKQLFFNKLNYDVTTHDDLSAQQMLRELEKFASDERLLKVDSCVIAILTHGTNNGALYGVDEIPITCSQLREIFTSTNCPALNGKPKLFIIQACKGTKRDREYKHKQYRHDVLLEEDRQPDHADMYFLNATVEGYVALRNYFIPHLKNVFMEHAHDTDVKGLATKLQGKLCASSVNFPKEYTTGESVETLTKTWFFNCDSPSPTTHA